MKEREEEDFEGITYIKDELPYIIQRIWKKWERVRKKKSGYWLIKVYWRVTQMTKREDDLNQATTWEDHLKN